MNTPNRPHEELDNEERELARVVRALPGNEPSPALDLRILKAAQDAVAAAPNKRTRRALWATSSAGSLWGFGTAAAAVLAVGISWQLFMQGPTGNFPASRPAEIADDSAQDRDATSVDFVSAKPQSDDKSAVAETNQPMSVPQPQRQRVAAAAEPKLKENQQTDGPHPFIDEHVTVAAAKVEADREKPANDLRADTALAETSPADNAAPASAPVASMAAPALEQAAPAAPPPMAPERREQEDFAKSSASSGLIAGGAAPATAAVGQAKADSGQATAESPDATRRRVRADVRLYPESWIRKIRTRLKQGDTAGARASLKLFVETYPQEAVPENLKPLLGE